MPPGFRRVWRSFDLSAIEYSRAKSEWTLESRGFDFEFAARIFEGEVLSRRDTRHRDEVRHQALGEAMGFVLFVVYTLRNGRCRIISARAATPEEAAFYRER